MDAEILPLAQFPSFSGPISTDRKISSKRAITPEISAFAERVLKDSNVPGLTLGFIRLEEGAVLEEHRAWGIMSEERNSVTSEVRSYSRLLLSVLTYDIGVDAVLYRIMLEGVLGNCTRTPDGRLCS